MPKQFISFDIETDFRRKLLNIGWCTSNIHDVGKEFFVWQQEKKLYYDNNCDPKYTAIVPIWRVAEKTPLGEILTVFKKDVKDKIVAGWNIKPFDIPIIRSYFKKYLDYDWRPTYFDGYLLMKKIIKKNLPLCERLMKYNGLTPSGKFPTMTAEAMFKYLTGCQGYQEWHTALYDAQDERHLIQLMNKIGISVFKNAKQFIPKN